MPIKLLNIKFQSLGKVGILWYTKYVNDTHLSRHVFTCIILNFLLLFLSVVIQNEEQIIIHSLFSPETFNID